MKNTRTNMFTVTGLLKTSALLLVSSSLLIASCKKDTSNDDPTGVQSTTSSTSSTSGGSTTSGTNPNPTVTKTDLITGKTWKLTAATVSPKMQGMEDMFAMMEDCEKDNTIKYNKDKSVVMNEGAQKCDMMDPQTKTGAWTFSSDEAVLTVDGKNYTLVNLSSNQLKTSYKMDMSGTAYTITMTYSGE